MSKTPSPTKVPSDLRAFDSLVKIMGHLRAPDGCPWDLEQTPKSLTPYAIEEAHELAEAVESGDIPSTVEELGDLLLQVVFHAEMGRQAGTFDIQDVIESINRKMVHRHPHVFGATQVSDSGEVLDNWEKLKKLEKGDSPRKGFGIPAGLPALQRAQKIGSKTKKVKFDWNSVEGVREKLREELGEFEEALSSGQSEKQEHELGDILFTVAQLARHLGLEAETCLRKTNSRFELRFETMMELCLQKGLNWDTLSDPQKEALWQEAKTKTDG